VDARLKFARGQYAAADEAHQRHASSLQSDMPAWFAELGLRYAEAARELPAQVPALPRAPCLPTRM
jgi:hypothetical protein